MFCINIIHIFSRVFRRKNESIINQLNLFNLLIEKLLLDSGCLSMATYNALFEILVEQICPEILFVKHEDFPVDQTRFENPTIIKGTSLSNFHF